MVQANNLSQISTSKPKYNADRQVVALLIKGDTDAWNRFYNEFRKKIEIYIKRKYPNVFSDIAIEEICDGVGKRLIENDYRALKDYRGDCALSTYLTKAADWETKDWLRKHSDELFSDPVDTLSSEINTPSINKEPTEYLQDTKNGIPRSVESLNDDLRWAFLLRYYDYFGFPLKEVRLLAQKRGVLIGDITRKIIEYLEPGGKDILRAQIERHQAFQSKIQKMCMEIQKLSNRERELLVETENNDFHHSQNEDGKSNKLDVVRNKLVKLDKKRKALLKNTSKIAVTTPYEIIAEILGEDNVSTIRSRVFHAKKELKNKLNEIKKTF